MVRIGAALEVGAVAALEAGRVLWVVEVLPGTRLPASGSRLPASGIRLPAPGSRLPAPGIRLPAPGSRLPAEFGVALEGDQVVSLLGLDALALPLALEED